jgi:type I restriction enzyme S subunit
MSSTKVLAGDVLLNITGASIGRVTWVPQLDVEANVNQHVCIIRLKPHTALPEFGSLQLSTPYFQNVIDSLQTGSSRQGLNFSQIRRIDLLVPPLPLQSQFVSRVREIGGLKSSQFDSQLNMNELKASLLQRAFRGEL